MQRYLSMFPNQEEAQLGQTEAEEPATEPDVRHDVEPVTYAKWQYKAPSTAKQIHNVILQFLASYYNKEQCPPTLREIQIHCGFKNINSIAQHLKSLEEMGLVIRNGRAHRGVFLGPWCQVAQVCPHCGKEI